MENRETDRSRNSNIKLRKMIYYVLGIIEALLAFRLVFKLLGANSGGAFVSAIYSISGALQTPFRGIFRAAVNNGIETKSVLDPTTIITMIVYALIAYGIVRLIKILETPKNQVSK